MIYYQLMIHHQGQRLHLSLRIKSTCQHLPESIHMDTQSPPNKHRLRDSETQRLLSSTGPHLLVVLEDFPYGDDRHQK